MSTCKKCKRVYSLFDVRDGRGNIISSLSQEKLVSIAGETGYQSYSFDFKGSKESGGIPYFPVIQKIRENGEVIARFAFKLSIISKGTRARGACKVMQKKFPLSEKSVFPEGGAFALGANHFFDMKEDKEVYFLGTLSPAWSGVEAMLDFPIIHRGKFKELHAGKDAIWSSLMRFRKVGDQISFTALCPHVMDKIMDDFTVEQNTLAKANLAK